jgi:hypothetical protein
MGKPRTGDFNAHFLIFDRPIEALSCLFRQGFMPFCVLIFLNGGVLCSVPNVSLEVCCLVILPVERVAF